MKTSKLHNDIGHLKYSLYNKIEQCKKLKMTIKSNLSGENELQARIDLLEIIVKKANLL